MTTAASYANLVQELYIAYFGRPADYFGLQNFEAALAAANAPIDAAALATAYSTNAAVKTLVDSFGTSAESTALYGSGSTESFVNAIFENLFGRPAAVSGLTFWTNAIESGQVSQGDAALAILAGSEPTSNSTQQATDDWNLVKAKVAVSNSFTTALGTSSTQIVDYSGATAAQDARLMLAGVTAANATTFDVQTTINNIVAGNTQNTYTLTTGVDTFAGGPGNDTFNAILDNATGVAAGGQATTLQAFDTITGGTLNNTLDITDFGLSVGTAPSTMTIPSGATITGITTLNVHTLEGVTLDLTSWSTLTQANILSSAGNDSVIVGDTVALQVVDSAGNVNTQGGLTVSATTDNGNAFNIEGGAATSTVTLTSGDGGLIVDNSTHNDTITSVTLINGGTGGTDIVGNGLTSLTLVGNGYSEIQVESAVGTRTLNLSLNDNDLLLVADNAATTVNVSTVTAESSAFELSFESATSLSFNDGVALFLGNLDAPDAKAVTISGAGDFTIQIENGLNAAAVIDATASSGIINIALLAGQSFTGGSGQDVITIGAGQTGAVVGGSAPTNEILLDNAPGATIADIASVKNFSIFGVEGSTSGTFDMSKVSGYTAFDVQESSGNVTFTNAATGSSLSLEGGNSHVITLQSIDGNAATDSVSVSLGTTTSEGNSYAQVTLEDSGLFGTATVNLTSNVSNASSENYLGSLLDNNLVTLTLSGTGTIEIGNIKTISTSLTITNATVNHSGISAYIDTLTANDLATLTIDGSTGIEIENLNTTSTALTIVDNNTAAFVLNTLADTALTSATFTNSVNTTSGTFTIGGTLSEPSLVTLNLNGNVALSITGDTVATGITVAGGTDNAHVTIDFAEATASGSTDSITLGNGAGDSVTLGAGLAGSTQTIVLGSGAGDSIVTTTAGAVNATVGSATTGTDTITADSASSLHATAGNGTNVISDTAAGAAIAITVGTGANTISVGDNTTGTINLGAHAATVADAITIGVSGTSLTAIEKIGGLNNSGLDTLTFTGDPSTLTFTQVTAAAVDGFHGNTTQLSDWIAAATGESGSGITGTAHSVMWFTFQNNTYLVETVGADSGALATGDTVVELTGTAYTFAHATTAGGIVHLMS